jgi:NAD-dependent dihydropyrimidine dehydrogenase PreA subunit
MAKRIAVVVSQGQSNNPVKRKLEEDIVTSLLVENGIDVTVVPNLYDLKPDGTGMLALQGIMGNMIVLSWLYPRAAFWTLDRNGIRGREGETLLTSDDEDESADDGDEEEKERVNDQREIPNRKIYCIGLQAANDADSFVEEIKRIATENSQQVVDLMQWIGGAPSLEQLARFKNPVSDASFDGNGKLAGSKTKSARDTSEKNAVPSASPIHIDETAARRWYPVIDFSRCTNCMECIDFCLFGVYGVDKAETILVEQPDNCRKGCPACSRVCPENAIMFPQHKTPAIAGASIDAGSLKIDLSKLFGAPESKEDPVQAAVRERDEQLVLAGREAVGAAIGLPKRQTDKTEQPKDDLDELLDSLDEMDL